MAISLQKGQKVNLTKKSSSGLGEILVNLNWNTGKKGFLSGLLSGGGIDLDLGCLYEMNDGRKGAESRNRYPCGEDEHGF